MARLLRQGLKDLDCVQDDQEADCRKSYPFNSTFQFRNTLTP